MTFHGRVQTMTEPRDVPDKKSLSTHKMSQVVFEGLGRGRFEILCNIYNEPAEYLWQKYCKNNFSLPWCACATIDFIVLPTLNATGDIIARKQCCIMTSLEFVQPSNPQEYSAYKEPIKTE